MAKKKALAVLMLTFWNNSKYMATQYKKEYPNLIIESLYMWANLNDVYF